MPINHGSAPKAPSFNPDFIGRPQTDDSHWYDIFTNIAKGFAGIFTGDAWQGDGLDIFRNVLTIAELLAILPTMGQSALVEGAVSLGFGITNQAIDIAKGQTNVFGTLMNLGLPVATTGITAGARISKINKITKGLKNVPDDISKYFIQSQAIEKNLGKLNIFQKTKPFNKVNREIGKMATEFINVDKKLAGKVIGKRMTEILKGGATKAGALSDNIYRAGKETNDSFIERLKKAGVLTERELALLRKALDSVTTTRQLRSLIRSTLNDLSENSIDVLLDLYEVERVSTKLKNIINLESAIAGEYQTIRATTFADKFPQMDALKRFWKYSGTSGGTNNPFKKGASFNTRFVQTAQLIDPNDVGRYPIEMAYQAIKDKLNGVFKKFAKAVGKTAKIDNYIDEWVKIGGKQVDSQWHLGYRIINRIGLKEQFVQITYAKNGDIIAPKDWTHIYLIATDYELKKYRESPGHYYRKRWAMSSGRKIDFNTLSGAFASFKGLENLSRGIFGFLPVQQVRNIFSIVTNWVENINDMTSGDYANQWFSKWKKSTINSAISRSFRLMGNVVARGYARKYFSKQVSAFIGKELQRAGTQLGAYSIKRVIEGKQIKGNDLFKRAIKGAVLSARSNVRSRMRSKHKDSIILATLASKRKFQIMNRIPNAVTPKRPYKGFKYKF